MRHMVYQPDDWSTVYRPGASSTTEMKLVKFKYVPNGECEYEPDFDLTWSQLNKNVDIRIDEDYVYAGEDNYKEIVARQLIHVIDYRIDEGAYEGTIDLTDWTYTPTDYEQGALMNTGNRESNLLPNGLYYLHEVTSCMHLTFDMNAWKNGEEFDDTVRFINGNGDYIMDKNFEEDSSKPWACNDSAPPPWSSTIPVESNGFGVLAASGAGAVSFALLAPDGTGVDYFTVAGEYGGKKSGDLIIDNESAFDGLLVPAVYEDWEDVWKEGPGMWWVGMDSTKGIITSNPVNVAGTTPSEFSVTQNVPNPFNPTTIIEFQIPRPSHITLKIFNMLGEEIKTLAENNYPAGSHTLTWNGTDNAGIEVTSGVYFYRLQSENFVESKKLIFLK